MGRHFRRFLERVPSRRARHRARSHQYIWDMMRTEGFEDANGRLRCELFEDELYGINDTIERVVDYFKAAAARSKSAGGCCCCSGRPPAASRPW